MSSEATRPESFKGVGLAGRFAIAGGLLAVALSGAFAVIYGDLDHVQGKMGDIVRVAQPMADAAFEMEISTIGAAFDVASYLHRPSAPHRWSLRKNSEDFQQFLARYREHAITDRQRDLATQLEARYDSFARTGEFLLDAKDRTDRDLLAEMASLYDFDRVLSAEFEARPIADRRRQAAVAETVQKLKRAAVAIPLLLANIERTDAGAENRIATTIQSVRSDLAALARAAPERGAAVRELSARFDAIAPRIEAISRAQREMGEGLQLLVSLRFDMSRILDVEIQRPTSGNLRAANDNVLQEVRSGQLTLAAALAVLAITLLAMSAYTVHWVTWPIGRLVDYAAEVGRGNFSASVDVTGGAEVGALARALTAMSRSLKDARDTTDRETASRIKLQENIGHAERIAAVGRLSGGIAHDFNNMLMVVNGHAEHAIKHTGEPKAVEKSLRDIQAAVGKAANLVRQLSIFGGRRAIQSRVFDVARLKEDVDGLIQLVAGEQQTIEYEFRDSARVRTDPGELTQAVLNLVTNASHASSPGSVIRLAVGTEDVPEGFTGAQPPLAPGRYVVVSVADRGTGIPASVVPRLFEPFFTTKALGDGTGLGLSMVYGFAEQSGGGIGLTTEIGQGSTFRIYLPVSELPEEIAEARDESIPHGRGESILLADDDQRLLNLTHGVLKELGYVVHAAKGGLDAVEIASDDSLRIDLMLSDVVMPVLSGPEAYDIIAENRPGLPVVFMSGAPDRLGAAKAPDHAMLLQKPVKTVLLAQALRSALEDRTTAATSPNDEPALV